MLVCKDIVKDYCSGADTVHALKSVSLSFRDHEFVSILGPSGCGKSTILNILAGLIEDYSGQLFVDDERIKGVSSHFAYMPQNDLLLEWRTILDNVCYMVKSIMINL
mgnify:CR=1 FL=1